MGECDLVTILRKELADLLATEEVPHSAASAITDQFIKRIQERFAGDRVLVPKIDRAKRDAAILADWHNGLTVEAIAKRQACCRQTAYRVINRGRRQRASGDDAEFGSAEWRL